MRSILQTFLTVFLFTDSHVSHKKTEEDSLTDRCHIEVQRACVIIESLQATVQERNTCIASMQKRLGEQDIHMQDLRNEAASKIAMIRHLNNVCKEDADEHKRRSDAQDAELESMMKANQRTEIDLRNMQSSCFTKDNISSRVQNSYLEMTREVDKLKEDAKALRKACNDKDADVVKLKTELAMHISTSTEVTKLKAKLEESVEEMSAVCLLCVGKEFANGQLVAEIESLREVCVVLDSKGGSGNVAGNTRGRKRVWDGVK